MSRCRFLAMALVLEGSVRAQPPASESLAGKLADVAEALNPYGIVLDTPPARQAAVDAVIRTCDPAARLYAAEEADLVRKEAEGKRHEAVVELTKSNGITRVVRVADDSPAAQAGLQAGDVVREIDGGDVSALTLQQTRGLLVGSGAVPARFRVAGTNEAGRVVEVARSPVQAPAIAVAEDLPLGLCYVKLNGLYAGSGKDVVSALRACAAADPAGIVLDLRGATGMDLQSAADVASLFAEPGALLFAVRDLRDQDLAVHKADGGAPLDVPAMVLLDPRTSGAAEALAATLGGSVRGVMLIGATTRGDPLVREWVPLRDGSSVYVATKRLVTADGEIYDGHKGVEPDIRVTAAAAGDADFEPAPDEDGRKEASEEEKEERRLRDRVRGDAELRRAADLLLGLRALDLRGSR